MYVCMYVCIHIYIYVCMCVYIHTYIHIYTSLSLYIYIYIYIPFFSPSPWFLVSALDALFSARLLERLAGARAPLWLQMTAGAAPRSVGRAASAATPRKGPGRRSGSAAS